MGSFIAQTVVLVGIAILVLIFTIVSYSVI